MKQKNDKSVPHGYDATNLPNPNMVQVLVANKVEVRSKKDGSDFLLWCNYAKLTKNKPNQGLEVWGRSVEIVEHITKTVLMYYPRAEVTSQNMNANVVFKLNS
jgi:hypothetical protein